jgi:hypothetical protein
LFRSADKFFRAKEGDMKIDQRIEILPVPSRAGSPERRLVPLVDALDRDGKGQQYPAFQRYNARKKLETTEEPAVPPVEDEAAAVDSEEEHSAKLDLRV